MTGPARPLRLRLYALLGPSHLAPDIALAPYLDHDQDNQDDGNDDHDDDPHH